MNYHQKFQLFQNVVLKDFSDFSAQQGVRQKEFENTVQQHNEDIAIQISNLEKSLDLIKSTASDNVSATLADFEARFGSDLKRRGEAIDDNLNDWKNSLESKLSVLGSDFENNRRELEQQYSESLKEKLIEIQP